MELDLRGKRALVTGSTTGIGEAIARLLCSEGVAVVVHGRDAGRGARLVDEFRSAGGEAAFVSADLASAKGAKQLVAGAQAAFGGIDILVNNVGIYPQHTWFEGPADDWARFYEVNVVACVRLVQDLVPPMRAAKWGRVVQISSGEATHPFPHMPGYAATKAALNNASASLCKALAGSGVTVNTISAGLIRTPEIEKWFQAEAAKNGWGKSWDEIEKKIIENYLPIPVGHVGVPEDVARLVAFVVSPQAGYVNGAVLSVDGGSGTWVG